MMKYFASSLMQLALFVVAGVEVYEKFKDENYAWKGS